MKRLLTALLFAALLGCESEVDMTIEPDDSIVLSSFFEPDKPMIIDVYGCTPYTDTVGISAIGEAVISLYVNGIQVRERKMFSGETSVNIGKVDMQAGDRVEVEVKADERQLKAATTILSPVEINYLDTATTLGNQQQLRCRLTFTDPNESNDYYQVVVLRHELTADGRELSKRLTCNYNDYLFLLSASTPLGGSDLLVSGLFDDGAIRGRTYTIGFSVEWERILSGVADDSHIWLEVFFYHHTSDFFSYQTTATVASDFLMLPMFGLENVYSNVRGGYGIFTSMTAAVDTIFIK